MQSRRLWVVVVLLPVLLSSCLFRDSPQRAADELAAISGTVTEATYAAIYRFGVTGALAGAVTTRMEIVQDPPVSLRKLDTTTQPEEGEPITLTSWFVRNADGDFACTQYQNIGVRCLADTIARGTFGNAQLDAFFDTPRESSSFSSVRKTSRPVRIQGEQGTCYEAVPASESDSAADSAQPTVASERFRFELCYAEDGILLRGRRTNLAEAEAAGSASSLVELVSLSRVVEPRELRLPGQVVEPDAVRQ